MPAKIEELKKTQNVVTRDGDIRVAVPGCLLFRGGYGSLGCPNWAGKYFADAIMLKQATACKPARSEAVAGRAPNGGIRGGSAVV